jgi:acyl-CoA synthetase (AMP-forming)/AMP-acid ligase II
VWSTFYDVRRYGGMSILVRSLLGGASLVLSSAEQSLGDFLLRAGTEGVTHISGTPSHWRRALMSPSIKALSPVNVRLSGEVADQAILDRLHAAFPKATVTHAFASTEAGVAFEVTDGLEGFPATMLDGQGVRAELRVEGDTLRIRSSRTASGYLGADLPASGGFVDTGDVVERRGDRYYFAGRKEGVINVGGQKVYPEEVEGVINRHPAVLVRYQGVAPQPADRRPGGSGHRVGGQLARRRGRVRAGARRDPAVVPRRPGGVQGAGNGSQGRDA